MTDRKHLDAGTCWICGRSKSDLQQLGIKFDSYDLSTAERDPDDIKYFTVDYCEMCLQLINLLRRSTRLQDLEE